MGETYFPVCCSGAGGGELFGGALASVGRHCGRGSRQLSSGKCTYTEWVGLCNERD